MGEKGVLGKRNCYERNSRPVVLRVGPHAFRMPVRSPLLLFATEYAGPALAVFSSPLKVDMALLNVSAHGDLLLTSQLGAL